MKFLTIRELQSSTSPLNEMLSDDEKVVLTTNGKPAALMIKIDESSFEDILMDIRAAQSRRAIRQLQEQALQTGLNHMSLEDINAEIAAARSESK